MTKISSKSSKVYRMIRRLYTRPIILLSCFLVLFFFTQCRGQEDTSPNTQSEREYVLVWSDEFDREGVPDPVNWTYELGFVRNEELQWYQPDNAFCQDGLMVIEGRREVVPNPDHDTGSNDWRKNRTQAEYTSASVTTRGLHAWRFGIFEIRARIKTQPGLWPAIWTLGENHEWPIGGEIDIMEFYNGNILANAAWAGPQRWKPIWDGSRKPVSSFPDPDWSDKFHIWKMEWTPSSIQLFVDDELLNTIPLDETINQRGGIHNPFRETHQYLLLNLAIGGTAGGDPTGTPFPTRYEIDYVRIYQLK